MPHVKRNQIQARRVGTRTNRAGPLQHSPSTMGPDQYRDVPAVAAVVDVVQHPAELALLPPGETCHISQPCQRLGSLASQPRRRSCLTVADTEHPPPAHRQRPSRSRSQRMHEHPSQTYVVQTSLAKLLACRGQLAAAEARVARWGLADIASR